MSQEASEGDTRYALLRHLSEHRDETVQPTDLVTESAPWSLEGLGDAALWLRERGYVECREYDVAEIRKPLFATITREGLDALRALDSVIEATSGPSVEPQRVSIERRKACRSALLTWLYDQHGGSQPLLVVSDFLRDPRSLAETPPYSPSEVAAAAQYLEDGDCIEVLWGMGGSGRKPTRARISHLDMRAIEAGPSSSPGAATINVVYVAGDVRDSQMQQASPEADQRFT